MSTRTTLYRVFNYWTIIGEAMLACGISDGSVNILVVRQTLTSKPGTTRFVLMHNIGLEVEAHGEKACDSDRRAITGMKWANITGRTVSFSSWHYGVWFNRHRPNSKLYSRF